MGIYNRILDLTARNESVQETNSSNGNLLLESTMQKLTAHIMIADEHNIIRYMNESIVRMLKIAEADIRKALPDFSVDTLIGSSIDTFHRNPAHQQSLLASLTSVHQAEIQVGGRHFSLTATPVFAEGRRIGTSVEWLDNTERHQLKLQTEEIRQRELENNRQLSLIKTGLDTVSSNVMLANPEGIIVYANPAVLQLLKTAEADIRKALPAFSSDRIVGSNFDIFHKNPAHQRNLLANLHQRFETNINVGGRTFNLNAAPVFDAERIRLGTVVEWQDLTEVLRLQADVEHTIEGAIAGNLDKRIDNTGYKGFMAQMADGINKLMSIFDNVLQDTETTLKNLAEGDLCGRITTNYEGRYLTLKNYINHTIEQLHKVVTDINTATESVRQSSHEISMGNLNLSQRTEEQAASLEETSSAMTDITQTVDENSRSANTARDLSAEARSIAEDGGLVVQKAVSAMAEISTSSSKIDEIISVIDEIAFQTNLLALNAAVEAARAGDQGKGFAVVADEVRSLASRSATAAKEIKILIKDSGTKVEEGSALVTRSGETLENIISAVRKVNAVIQEITVNSEEQASSLSEVSKAVSSMDDMTQQNAALVEEAAAASESLHNQADRLAELVKYFKI